VSSGTMGRPLAHRRGGPRGLWVVTLIAFGASASPARRAARGEAVEAAESARRPPERTVQPAGSSRGQARGREPPGVHAPRLPRGDRGSPPHGVGGLAADT
jgi:hypothetical protein